MNLPGIREEYILQDKPLDLPIDSPYSTKNNSARSRRRNQLRSPSIESTPTMVSYNDI